MNSEYIKDLRRAATFAKIYRNAVQDTMEYDLLLVGRQAIATLEAEKARVTELITEARDVLSFVADYSSPEELLAAEGGTLHIAKMLLKSKPLVEERLESYYSRLYALSR